jgi:hypothetical protein
MWWARLLNNIAGFLGGGLPPIGDYESIATTVVGAGGTSNISFGVIPSTYKHLQIRFSARNNFAGSGGGISALVRLNSDTGGNYTNHRLVGDGGGGAPTAGAQTGITSTNLGYMSRNGDTNNFSASVVDILDYSNTNKYTTLRTLSGSDYNGSGYIQVWSGLWLNTSAVSSIDIFPDGSASWLQYSHFALYGIKG